MNGIHWKQKSEKRITPKIGICSECNREKSLHGTLCDTCRKRGWRTKQRGKDIIEVYDPNNELTE